MGYGSLITVDGQLSLWDGLDALPEKKMTAAADRIQSLERTKQHRQYSRLSEKLSSKKYDFSMYLSEVLNEMAKVIRPLIKNISTESPMESDEYKQLRKLTGNTDFKLYYYDQIEEACRNDDDNSGKYPRTSMLGGISSKNLFFRVCRIKNRQPDENPILLWCPDVYENMLLGGLKIGRQPKKCLNAGLLSNTYFKLVDISCAIAWIIMIDTARSNFFSEDIKKTIHFKELGQRCLENLFGPHATEQDANRLREATLRPVILYTDNSRKSIGKITEALKRRGITVYLFTESRCEWREHPIFQYLETVLPAHVTDTIVRWSMTSGNQKNPTPVSGLRFYKELRSEFRKRPQTDYPIFWKESEAITYLLYEYAAGHPFDKEDADAIISRAEEHANPATRNFALPSFYSKTRTLNPVGIVLFFFILSCAVMEREIRAIKEEREERSDYARSFQTKKNIPEKIRDFMEKSKLNRTFGFVEYDEDADIVKAAIVEEQILEFCDSYFEDESLKPIKLRFRRLGNHKAIGLYYPSFQTICIDIRHPNSFIHEFGHCMDYEHGELSNCLNSREFTQIYSRYEYLLRKKVEDGGIKLHGKFNLDYYLKETEVFARSFETYFAYCMGIDNSLLKTKEEYASDKSPWYHPEDELYLKLIDDYFSGNFSIIKPGKERSA